MTCNKNNHKKLKLWSQAGKLHVSLLEYGSFPDITAEGFQDAQGYLILLSYKETNEKKCVHTCLISHLKVEIYHKIFE